MCRSYPLEDKHVILIPVNPLVLLMKGSRAKRQICRFGGDLRGELSSDQRLPLLASRITPPALSTGFQEVTGGLAESLQVRCGPQFAALVDRLNVVEFQPPRPSAAAATIPVALKDLPTQPFPSSRVEVRRVLPGHARRYRQRRCFGPGPCRRPSATARIAASSRARRRRPPSAPFASFALPAGSATVLAAPMQLDSSNDGTGTTPPSSTARLKPRTSSAPSRNPIPRTVNGQGGTFAALRLSRSSPSRQRSQTILDGAPNRCSASLSSCAMLVECPSVSISSPRSKAVV